MQTYKLQTSPTKEYYTEPILKKEDWLKILPATEKKHPRQYEALLMFLRQPEHKSSCIALEKEYSVSFESINSLIMNFGKFVIKETGNWFRIEQNESSEDTFWPVAMSGKHVKKAFEWTLRPELVDALQEYLLEKMISKYEERILSEGLNNSITEELYKWTLLTECKGKSTEDILKLLCKTNIIDSQYDGAAVKKLMVSDGKDLADAFDHLRGETWDTSYEDFKQAADQLTSGKFKYRISDERMAAAFAACCNPDRHTFYKSELYSLFCSYIGIEKKSAGEKYSHYLSILPLIIERENNRDSLIKKLQEETNGLVWSDLLNAQDVLWQMKDFMQKSICKNWLQKLYDNSISTNHWVFSNWYPEYKKSISRFLGLFEDGKTANDCDDQTIEYLIRTPENYISSNTQGCYTFDEYAEIKKQWPYIYDVLKANIYNGKISREDYDILSNRLRSLTSKNKSAAHHRIWAAVFPGYISTVITSDRFFKTYSKIREIDENLPQSTGKWLEDNITLIEYLKQKVEFMEPEQVSLFPWYLYEELNKQDTKPETSDMDKYIDLLLANHNLILTGAPGTGKTYLAKQIAKAMGAEYKLVQFHPSYDYTDFVEGLRPCEDMSGFERIDGVFKKFCASAVSSVKTSNFEEAYDKLVSDLIESGTPLPLTTPNGGKFAISVNRSRSLNLYTGSELKINGSLTKDNLESQLGGNKTYKWWQGYFKGVEKLLIEKYGLSIDSKNTSDKYVFIIDEINRGELSKIFGELFFAIDPGYRGLDDEGKPKGLVQTQYQNMVSPEDVFYEGFYVPDNVYILGTMNDIDRGVESMDFAIRRRFAWMEVTADERASMLDGKEWGEKAKTSMTKLNEAIESKEVGLSSAYHVGPSYYLKLDQYDGDFEKLWDYHIKGLLNEYLRGGRDVSNIINNILKPAFEEYKKA